MVYEEKILMNENDSLKPPQKNQTKYLQSTLPTSLPTQKSQFTVSTFYLYLKKIKAPPVIFDAQCS
jgi:hypothetical protein